jgi:Putative DNA-binding domain
MASLREVQESFAAALRDPALACAVLPPANLAIYRNNTHIVWRETLERTYPVVRRRVGDEYFRQLCAHYRDRFPSRSGDLHWYGRDFADFLDSYLDGDYRWLGDLARLEWSRAECSVADEPRSIGAEALAQYSAEQLEHVVFGLQPSLRLHSSSFPVFSVWENNQIENAPPADQSLGSESGLVRMRYELPELLRLDPGLYSFLSALAGGSTLGEAMTRAALDGQALADALAFLFREGLVSSLALREPAASNYSGGDR